VDDDGLRDDVRDVCARLTEMLRSAPDPEQRVAGHHVLAAVVAETMAAVAMFSAAAQPAAPSAAALMPASVTCMPSLSCLPRSPGNMSRVMKFMT
jgi:hypothetical protein